MISIYLLLVSMRVTISVTNSMHFDVHNYLFLLCYKLFRICDFLALLYLSVVST